MKGSNALLFLFLIDAVAFIIIPKKDEVLFISACVLLVEDTSVKDRGRRIIYNRLNKMKIYDERA